MQNTNILQHNKDMIHDKAVISAIGVLFFVLATALGAYVRIPVKGTPVPITLQTFFVITSGAVLGRKLGGFSQFAYLALGMAGMPIFQSSGLGMAYLLGPTGGYLIGFIAAAYIVGRMTEMRNSSFKWLIISFASGSALILACGTLWLSLLFKISPIEAISIGALPFVPGDAVKVAVAAIIYSKISGRSKKIFSA